MTDLEALRHRLTAYGVPDDLMAEFEAVVIASAGGGKGHQVSAEHPDAAQRLFGELGPGEAEGSR